MRRLHQATGGEFTYGLELIIDIDHCDLAVISDPDALKRYISGLVDRIQMKAFEGTWIRHFGHGSAVTSGYTAFQPIETSSIVVHVSDGLRRVHVNVFSCRRFDALDAMDYTETFFGGTDTTYTVLSR